MAPSDTRSVIEQFPEGSSERRLLEDACRAAEQCGVRVVLSNGPWVHQSEGDGMPCSGFFLDRPVPTLAVALGHPAAEWVPIFAHESSHFDQWREQAPEWTDLFRFGDEASLVLDAWLEGGREFSPSELGELVGSIKAVEFDAERRTLAKMQSYGVKVDPAEYAQKSNAYVMFYDWCANRRRWSEAGRPVYRVESIWRHAPAFFPDAPPIASEAFLAACDEAYPVVPARKAKP